MSGNTAQQQAKVPQEPKSQTQELYGPPLPKALQQEADSTKVSVPKLNKTQLRHGNYMTATAINTTLSVPNEHFSDAIRITNGIEEPMVRCRTQRNLAEKLAQVGDTASALSVLESAEKSAEHCGPTKGWQTLEVAGKFIELGELNKAAELALSEKVRGGRGFRMGQCAEALLTKYPASAQNDSMATHWFSKAEQFLSIDDHGEFRCSSVLAGQFINSGKLEDAARLLDKMHKAINPDNVDSKEQIGEIAKKYGEMQSYEQAADLAASITDPALRFDAQLHIAKEMHTAGKPLSEQRALLSAAKESAMSISSDTDTILGYVYTGDSKHYGIAAEKQVELAKALTEVGAESSEISEVLASAKAEALEYQKHNELEGGEALRSVAKQMGACGDHMSALDLCLEITHSGPRYKSVLDVCKQMQAVGDDATIAYSIVTLGSSDPAMKSEAWMETGLTAVEAGWTDGADFAFSKALNEAAAIRNPVDKIKTFTKIGTSMHEAGLDAREAFVMAAVSIGDLEGQLQVYEAFMLQAEASHAVNNTMALELSLKGAASAIPKISAEENLWYKSDLELQAATMADFAARREEFGFAEKKKINPLQKKENSLDSI